MSVESKIGQTFENPEGITPKLARQDYWNEIHNFTFIVEEGETDEEWRAKLKRYNVIKMRTFTENFPADRYPGIIEAQPPGTVQRFDQIATEVTQSLQAGTITISRVRELANEMRTLCYQE